jgi:hypothetical protein
MRPFRHLLRTAVCVLCCAAALSPVPTAAQQPPGVSYASLLMNVNMAARAGTFSIGSQMQAVFLPAGTQGWMIVRSAAGADLVRHDFTLEAITEPYTMISVNKVTDLRTGETLTPSHTLEPGSYVLDFHTEKGKFHTFPFSIEKRAPKDPFSGGALWYLDGDWSDWTYLFYSQADPSKALVWKIFLRQQVEDKLLLEAVPRVTITRRKGGALVCMSREMRMDIPHEWVRFEFDMIFPKEKYGEYFKAKDLLDTDGEYVLTFTLDGKPVGNWEFSVKDHRIQSAGRTVRGTADPLTFIEGGKDAFWMKKK